MERVVTKDDKRRRGMLLATILMAFVALVLFAIAYYRGEGQHVAGAKTALTMGIEILPLLFFAFMVAGLVQVLIPKEMVASWIGAEAGMRGIIFGTIAGGLTPGGPFVSLPIAAGIMRAGAGIGTMVAYVTAWSLLAVARLPMEVGIMGWRFTLVRLACTFFFPPIAGLLAQSIFKQ